LQPTYRIEGGVPIIHLYGRLDTGEAFLVRETRQVPHFFVRAADADGARRLGAVRQTGTRLRTFRGEPVVRIEVDTPGDAPPLRDALQAQGLPVFEGDVRFAMRYLIDAGVRGVLQIDPGEQDGGGEQRRTGCPKEAALRQFFNPAIAPSDWEPSPDLLRVVSLDLETDPRAEQILSAAIAGAGGDEVLLALPPSSVPGPPPHDHAVTGCGDERGLIKELFARLRASDFDILTGWNVIDFDLSVLEKASRRLAVPFDLGREPGPVRLQRDGSFRGRSRAEVTGRLVLDGIELLKGAFVKLEDYRLETAARELLGEGKVNLGKAGEPEGRQVGRAEAILQTFRHDLPRFVAYNLADARLVLRILKRADLIALTVRRSLLTGMPPDRVGASIASFDYLYLQQLRSRGRVAPCVGAAAEGIEPTAGGAVLDPVPGLYDNVLAFDFRSLYPSLIRTFNIDPLGYLPPDRQEGTEDAIRAPNGALFSRQPGILPGMLADLFPRRAQARGAGDAIGAHALKILMNSFYGVLATPACRFYSSAVANAITHFGQWALLWARDQVRAWGHDVLYGDTDSLFVTSGLAGGGRRGEAAALGERLCRRVNEVLREQIARTWRVDSHLELEFEALYLKLFLPPGRHGQAGARKRYAGLVAAGGVKPSDELVFVGMEMVRRDWTMLSKIFQRGLFERLFRGVSRDDVVVYLRSFIAELRRGDHDRHLVYRKALRKRLADYTATTPPHVKAARKLGPRARGLIEYVVTTAGPEPVAALTGAIDYPHYVERQVRPIAEQVLPLLGLTFEEALGEEAQGRLFH
ncbi:MAG TPA: DNA polymerase II, partial [Candidatus Polarisedimenticolia bacterium]|nr:DNA polymerase II [Candidatus Polarisedimenticolia bacterium]